MLHLASFQCDQCPFAVEKTPSEDDAWWYWRGDRDKTISSNVKAGITLLVGVSTGGAHCPLSRANTR